MRCSYFDAKKGFDIGRQTNFLKLDELESGKSIELPLKGKDAKKITIEIVDNGSFNPKDVGIIEESKDK